MANAEYKLKSDEIKRLIKEKDYRAAVEIADTIDWRRVRSITTLCTISDLYKINRRYEDARMLLESAYDKCPTGRQIVYSLCELCLKMGDIVGATEYFKVYCQIAPTDVGRDILLYKIYEAQDVNLEERIEVLEKLKKKEYTEKWGYELAYMYHRVGLASKCVEECDELILWFREGRYVKKAMELKMLHQQLTQSQETIYQNMLSPKDRDAYVDQVTVHEPEVTKTTNVADEIQVKNFDVGQYSTINIQKAIAESMKDVLVEDDNVETILKKHDSNAPKKAVKEVKKVDTSEEDAEIEEINNSISSYYASVPEEIEEAVESLTDNDDMAEQIEEIEEATPVEEEATFAEEVAVTEEEEKPEVGSITEAIMAPLLMGDTGELQELFINNEDFEMEQKILGTGDDFEPEATVEAESEKEAIRPASIGDEVEVALSQFPQQFIPEEIGEDYTMIMPTITEEQMKSVTQDIPQEPKQQVTQDTLVYSPRRTPNVVPTPVTENDIDLTNATKEDLLDLINQKVAEALEKALGAQTETSQPSSVPAPHHYSSANVSTATPPVSMQKMLSQEYDGQISLVVPETEKVEKQITGQINIDEFLEDWENSKKQKEAEYQKNLKQRLMEQTGALFSEFDMREIDKLLEEEKTSAPATNVKTAEVKIEPEKVTVSEDVPEVVEVAVAKEAISELPEVEEIEEIEETTESDVVETEESAILSEDGGETESVEDVEEFEEIEEVEEVSETAENAEEMEEVEEAHENVEEISEEAVEDTETATDITESQDEEEVIEEPEEIEEVAQAAKSVEKEAPSVSEELARADIEGTHDRIMTEDELALFSAFVQTKSAKKQLMASLDNISLASYTGNVFVTGDAKEETVELARSVLKYVQATDSNFVGKTGKVSGISLNNKPIEEMIEKLNNGGLIIEKASGMNAETVNAMLRALNQDNLGVLIIMQDTQKAMNKMMEHFDGMKEIFNVNIQVEELSDDTLVAYGRKYAEHLEYAIDEMGMLALHTRIEAMQTSDHIVTVADVRDIVDAAIEKANKKNLKHFSDVLFGKRYDDEDMIILKERDFDN